MWVYALVAEPDINEYLLLLDRERNVPDICTIVSLIGVEETVLVMEVIDFRKKWLRRVLKKKVTLGK